MLLYYFAIITTLINIVPDRDEELKEGLNKFDRLAGELFEKMNFTPVKQQEIMLSVLWFTAEPWCQFNDLSFPTALQRTLSLPGTTQYH